MTCKVCTPTEHAYSPKLAELAFSEVRSRSGIRRQDAPQMIARHRLASASDIADAAERRDSDG